MTGDFNPPSHLDWTVEVAAVRPDVVIYPVEWPVSKVLADAGLRDSYREAYPDPVAKPGFTWTPGSLEEIPDEVHDRIDWALAAGPPPARAAPGGGVRTCGGSRGVPELCAAVDERRVCGGDKLVVRFHGEGDPVERIAVVPAGEGVGRALASRSTGRA